MAEETKASEIEELTAKSIAPLFELIRAILRDSSPSNAIRNRSGLVTVNLTVRIDGRLRASMSGCGSSLHEAVEAAAFAIFRDKRLGVGQGHPDLDKAMLELWIQTEIDRVPYSQLASRFDIGVHGLEIRNGNSKAYYKPSVPITSDMRLDQVVRKLSAKAGLGANAWKHEDSEFFVTSWRHFVQSANSDCFECHRLRPVVRQRRRTGHDILAASINRLTYAQDLDGRFKYLYQPFSDRYPAANYNTVRHAGCTYACAWASQALVDSAVKHRCGLAARAGIGLLLQKYLAYSERNGRLAYFGELNLEHGGKLGTVALTLLALQFGDLRERYVRLRNQLVDTVLSQQEQDTGRFRCYVDTNRQGQENEDFFPGEALLALCHEYSHNKSESIKSAVGRSFSYYREHFRRRPKTAFVLWQTDAWRLFHELTTENPRHRSKYSDFVFEQIDWLLKFQHTSDNSKTPEYHGGFSHPKPPKYSSATFTEAVVRGYGLAKLVGDKSRKNRYGDAASQGLRFASSLMIDRQLSEFFPNPDQAVGGTTESLTSFTVRCDFDQHLSTAFLSALEHPELVQWL